MKTVLVACEESQAVCKAFRMRGFNAFSADLQPPSGGFPEWHIQGDCLPLLQPDCVFTTVSGAVHQVKRWDLIIAHPPCTYLSNAGHCRLIVGGNLDSARYDLGLAARDFFLNFYSCDCDHVAIENPIPIKLFNLPEYDQIIQPFYFGDPYYKTTCLWLRDLPCLSPTDICSNPLPTTYAPWWNSDTRKQRQINRSKTFPGIARAMAAQWGDYLLSGYKQLSLF